MTKEPCSPLSTRHFVTYGSFATHGRESTPHAEHFSACVCLPQLALPPRTAAKFSKPSERDLYCVHHCGSYVYLKTVISGCGRNAVHLGRQRWVLMRTAP